MNPKHRARFLRLVSAMNKLITDVQEEYPEAQYYLANDCLYILSGDSHEGSAAVPQRDRELVSKTLVTSGGGDW